MCQYAWQQLNALEPLTKLFLLIVAGPIFIEFEEAASLK